MYAKTRTYTTNKHDLSSLPLEELAFAYSQIQKEVSDLKAAAASESLERKKLEFLAKYNAENEAPYEGDFEFLRPYVPKSISEPNLTDSLVTAFCSKHRLGSWFFSQAQAAFAQLPLEKNSDGKISAKALLVNHIKPSPKLTALWLLFTHSKRSELIVKQSDPEFTEYCTLVPLIMAAFKRFNNTQYSCWAREEIHGITECNLAEAMKLTSLPDVTMDEVLEDRDYALTVKSGRTAGTKRNPVSTFNMFLPKESKLYSLSPLVKIMMCQTWCAHPSLRNKYCILNPLDWDNTPEPLIQTEELFVKPTKIATEREWWER
jgi:hypothetical protein